MRRILCLITLISFASCAAYAAQQAPAQAKPSDVSITVTVLNDGPDPNNVPKLAKDAVVIRQNGEVRPILEWKRLADSKKGIDFAILIDDSLQANVALQWKDIGSFIRNLPQNARVELAYGTQSAADISQSFTSDRTKAINALRLPLGRINEGSSIYLSLVDLIHRWPNDGHRRAVLLVSDGIDVFYGIRDSEPGINMNLQRAIDTAEKNGVVVNTIFASGISHFSHNLFLINNGQSSLARLALESGGSAFASGLQTPVSFGPFLSQLQKHISNMYLLTFRAKLPSQAGFAGIQLSAEPRNVELLGPSRVYLPAAQ